MFYRAEVVDNDPYGEGSPGTGWIRVICPMLFKWETEEVLFSTGDEVPDAGSLLGSELLDVRDRFIWSPCWIEPMMTGHYDFYVPDLGETVWVTKSDRGYLWFGAYIGQDEWKNYITSKKMEAFNLKVEDLADRIIGTKCGSYIKLEDDLEGNLDIECQGDYQGLLDVIYRKGQKISLIGDPLKPGIEILAGKIDQLSPDPTDPDLNFSIKMGGMTGVEKIVIKDGLYHNDITLGMDGITLGNGLIDARVEVIIGSTGSIYIKDLFMNEVKIGPNGVIVDDYNGNTIVTSLAGVTINSNLLVLK